MNGGAWISLLPAMFRRSPTLGTDQIDFNQKQLEFNNGTLKNQQLQTQLNDLTRNVIDELRQRLEKLEHQHNLTKKFLRVQQELNKLGQTPQ